MKCDSNWCYYYNGLSGECNNNRKPTCQYIKPLPRPSIILPEQECGNCKKGYVYVPNNDRLVCFSPSHYREDVSLHDVCRMWERKGGRKMTDKMTVEQAVDILTDDKIFLVGNGYKLKAMEISVANNMAAMLTARQQMLQRACALLAVIRYTCPAKTPTTVPACYPCKLNCADEWMKLLQKEIDE